MSVSIELATGTAVPESEQIRAQIQSQILAGALTADSRLPSVRQLAGDLGVAARTVAKAYSALEAAGLVTTSRSRGTRVAPGRAAGNGLNRAARRFVLAARSADVSLAQALATVEQQWNELDPTNQPPAG